MPPQSVVERFHDWAVRLGAPAESSARSRPSLTRWLGPLVALALVGGGGWWFLKPPPAPIEAGVPLAGASAGAAGRSGSAGPAQGTGDMSAAGPNGVGAGAAGAGGDVIDPSATTTPVELVVQASGGVIHPGVYRLPTDARVDDLVRSAGGLGPEADGDRVNLAAPLVDGERVWIPRRGELAAPVVVAGAATGGSGTGGARPGGAGAKGGGTSTATPAVVDLNSATAAELEALPGVGPATATAILSYREEHGRFASVDDLLEVRGIGDAKLEQIRPLARV